MGARPHVWAGGDIWCQDTGIILQRVICFESAIATSNYSCTDRDSNDWRTFQKSHGVWRACLQRRSNGDLQYDDSVVISTVELPLPHARLAIAFSWRFLLNWLAFASQRLDIADRRATSERGRCSGWANVSVMASRLAAKKEEIFISTISCGGFARAFVMCKWEFNESISKKAINDSLVQRSKWARQ